MLCQCCQRCLVWQTGSFIDFNWFCYYCDPKNQTEWKCSTCNHTTISNGIKNDVHTKIRDQIIHIPQDNKEYKKKEYWEQRFSVEENYEWLANYTTIRHLLNKYINPTDNILVVGCGNSELSVKLYDDGYQNITNIDFSKTIIHRQKKKYKDKTQMIWLEMNMMNLSFPAASFDVVLDKAAMDSLLVDEGDPWNPTEKSRQQIDQMCTEIVRVLKVDGTFLMISFGQPHFRCKNYLEKRKYGWTVEHTVFGQNVGFGYFLYIMQKQAALLNELKRNVHEHYKEQGEEKTILKRVDTDSSDTENDIMNINI